MSHVCIVLLVVVGLVGVFGQTIPDPRRVQLPSPADANIRGFSMGSTSIDVASSNFDVLFENGVVKFPVRSTILKSVVLQNSVSSFCDFPDPRLIEPQLFDGSGEDIDVSAGQGLIVKLTDAGGDSFILFMITDETFLPYSLVGQFQPWLRPGTGAIIPTCNPRVERAVPPFIWSQGSIIYIQGSNFGTNTNGLTVNIGSFTCDSLAMVVSQSVLKCSLKPSGQAPGGAQVVTVRRGQAVSASTAALYFAPTQACGLQCLEGTYPDPGCQQCIPFESTCGSESGTGGEPQAITVEDLSSFFITDLVRGQRSSDDNFLQVATTYRDTLLEKFPMPRYSIPEADVNVAVAINAAIPRLEVVAVTQRLENFPVETLSHLNFKLIADEARWTRFTNSSTGETAFRLDF